MRYEWDEAQNREPAKTQRHLLRSRCTRLEDDRCLVFLDRTDERTGEQRWIALGAAQPAADTAILLVVAHVYREEANGEEIIRIISARQAEKNEIRRYQAQALDES